MRRQIVSFVGGYRVREKVKEQWEYVRLKEQWEVVRCKVRER